MTTPKQRNPEWRTKPLPARQRHVAQFRVEVVSGPDHGVSVISSGTELSIGTAPENQLILTDGTVSRYHCKIVVDKSGFELRDLESTNGTTLGGYRVSVGFVEPNAAIGVGHTLLRFDVTNHEVIEALSDQTRLGEVIGDSAAMRRLFFMLDRAIAADTVVLLEGETGTGKTLIAETLHSSGPRAARPFVVIDCGAVTPSLIESELFGHERGAFTGAVDAKQGMFEAANGGTVFLDEIGELPLELQPKLLRVLESKSVTRIGTTRSTKLDVRIIAATNRDLRTEVNRGMFRSDLLYRISTLRVRVPPLRDRLEDVALLVDRFYREFSGIDGAPPSELLMAAMRHRWPGNVRELRSYIERSCLLGSAALPDDAPGAQPANPTVASFRDAKAKATDEWEAGWLSQLLAMYGGNISRAARAAKMDRNHLRDLLARHKIGLGDTRGQ